ncbi:MAG: hypothetical protein ACR2I2_10790 [Bryobacteraceae bacterium]
MRAISVVIAAILGSAVNCPTSFAQNQPHGHPRDTNPGRRPAPPRKGDGNNWIVPMAIGGGAGVVALGVFLHAHSNPAKELAGNGPQMPGQFTMSGFEIHGFCQGNWPVALDFALDPGATLIVNVVAEGAPAFEYAIPATGQRQEAILQIPANFPLRPAPGLFTIRGVSKTGGGGAPPYLRIFGVGAGKRAVGSVAIDQVRFGPQSIRPRQKEAALYSFHAHTDFDKVKAEFLKAVFVHGELVAKLEDHDDVNGVARETSPSRPWSGKKATPGEHILQVRAWESAADAANWVIAWSADQVMVEE